MVRHAALKNLYETEKTIGTGGFAKVKLARHLLTGEKVAIKIMDKSCLGDDLPRVKMELEALKNLSHHHICKLYQVIETETHFFLVMEYCSGGELFDHIVQCSRLSEMESRSFFRQILSAVAYLHSKGYVHRDIKPENVLLDKDQCVKLIDFGLCAKPCPAIDSYLETACGSPTYAAPELIKGDKYLGEAIDVWSMGVMLYALLCGCLPFESDKIDVLYKQIVSGKYNAPEHLSEGSRKILRDMLETDPTKRITIEKLLSHKWVQLGYNEPVTYNSLCQELELDNNCVNTMASHFFLTAEEMWRHLTTERYDSHAATYQLLLARKKQGLPLRLGQYTARTARSRLQSMRRTVANGGNVDTKGTYVKMPASHAQTVQNDKENKGNKMHPPEATPAKLLRKRPRSPQRESSVSPAPKKAATTGKPTGSGTKLKIPRRSNESEPRTPNSRTNSPSTRLFNSIERKFQHVRRVLTPKRRSTESAQPALLTAKNMSNISTTSSNSPDQVREELVKALNNRGIECVCKGYSVRGKVQAANEKMCKLSFELEVCLIPTSANASGSVVGIRRKRLKGDAWCYKRVCEEILNMADLK
ncbi:LOW QUALITY PROTEIN: maternal embryonic leucine zipper kinase-like [Homalodisca vitripennis]|nr:LOW QUALITY PROTEIN: maternal embryonic leucine zipper kinase-like [Homalodisca vitripennis]